MVEDIPIFWRDANLPSAQSDTTDGRNVFHDPSHFVQAMDRLLDDVIAREPGVVVPIFDLVLDVGPIGLARDDGFNKARVVGGVKGARLPNGAFMNLLH